VCLILRVALRCGFSSAWINRKRTAKARRATTPKPPPIAAPIMGPTEACAAGGAGTGTVLIPAIGLGDGESVGPGVSVGVTEGDAPMRSVGVGLGVWLAVGLGVMDGVGVGL